MIATMRASKGLNPVLAGVVAMASHGVLDDFLSRRQMAEETLSNILDEIRQIESEHQEKLRANLSCAVYSLARQGDTLARICQLRDWANILSEQLRAK
jgi:hypothetical protein